MGNIFGDQSSYEQSVIHPKSQIKVNQIFESLSNHSKLPQILQNLSAKLKKSESFIEKIDKIIMRNYNPNQKEQVYNLLKHWGNKNVLNQNIDHLIKEQLYAYYKEVDVLSARVYKRTLQIIEMLKEQALQADPISQNISVRLFLQNKNIQISYDRYLFAEVNLANSRSQYQYNQRYDSAEESSNPSNAKSHQQINTAYLLIAQCRIPQLKKLFQFLVGIGIFVLRLYRQTDNIFIQRMERIGKKDQKKLYIESMQFESLEDIIRIQKSKQDPEVKQQKVGKLILKNCINYHFYLKHITEGQRSLHKLFERYDTLEERHDYIQWMFPNHYQSAYNSQALPMNYLEKRFFLDEEMGLKMLVSVYIFFDFLGVRLDLNTFELSMCDESRFRSAIVVHTHNHLRLMRILACLSIVGFRDIALKFIAFLDRNTQRGTIGEKYRYEFENSWKIYGDEREGTPKAKAKTMCFLEEENFPQQHSILKRLTNNSQKQASQIKLDSEIIAHEEPVQQTYIIDQEIVNKEPTNLPLQPFSKRKNAQKAKGPGLEIQIKTHPYLHQEAIAVSNN